jgi:RNA polymerase sigma factor (sigma-70 family)
MSAHAFPTPKPLPRLRPLRTRSDEALRAMSSRGDQDAFTELYERHQGSLYRYCRSILHHDEDARDAMHSTMTNAWASLQRADRDVPVRAWLYRIAHNEAISVLRRRRPHDELDDLQSGNDRSLDETVEVRQRLAALRADLADLPERQRSALLLRELCGLAHAEIAAVLAVSPAVVKQSIFEGRTALHEAEAGRRMTCDDVRRTLSHGDGRVRRARRIKGPLRACDDCAAFQHALRTRPGQLAALFPPLPGAAGVGLLARLLSSGGASGGASSAAAGGGAACGPPAAATGAAAANLATGLTGKLVAGSLIALTAGGVATTQRIVGDAGSRPAQETTSVQPPREGASVERRASGDPKRAAPVVQVPVPPRRDTPAGLPAGERPGSAGGATVSHSVSATKREASIGLGERPDGRAHAGTENGGQKAAPGSALGTGKPVDARPERSGPKVAPVKRPASKPSSAKHEPKTRPLRRPASPPVATRAPREERGRPPERRPPSATPSARPARPSAPKATLDRAPSAARKAPPAAPSPPVKLNVPRPPAAAKAQPPVAVPQATPAHVEPPRANPPAGPPDHARAGG